MDITLLRRRALRALVVLGVLSLLASLWLLSEFTQNSQQFERLHAVLLVMNIGGVIVLLAVIAVNLIRLVGQYRRHVPGTRLTGRMVTIFSVLAVVPLMLVYYFSIQFITRSIDSWFDVRVEAALEDSLELSRTALDLRMQELLADTERMGRRLSQAAPEEVSLLLDELRHESGAAELTVFRADGRIVATSTQNLVGILDRPSEEILVQVRQGRDYVGLDPIGSSGMHMRAVVDVAIALPQAGDPADDTADAQLLQALYPVRARLSELADSVQGAFSRYRQLSYLREPLKYSFTLTLSLVLLISLLGAIWGAFYFSRRLVRPIQDLAEGTRAVAKGDFDTRLPTPSRDEVGFLVISFNEMTRRLAEARDEARHSRQAVEAERAYLEAILTRLSTGVIAVDSQLRLRTANAASEQILGAGLEQHQGRSLEEIAEGDPDELLTQFAGILQRHFDAGEAEWREEMVLRHHMNRRILMCSCTSLATDDVDAPNHVLVFDDLTTLIGAQRDAAWGEVARRLAHEIKNPLTPIQLSAERLRMRLLDHLEGKDRELTERAIHTIVQQVEAMKAMVNAFGDYARAPSLDMAAVDLNALVREVAELYRARPEGIAVELDLDADMPKVEVDPGRMRQILHNLIKNAQEALGHTRDPRVWVTTRYDEQEGMEFARIVVRDNGPGFQKDLVAQVFDPYVTSKPKGTGLGLAIVKKLVEEHAGSIDADNAEGGGAQVEICLPVDEATRSAMLLRDVPTPGQPQSRGRKRETR